MDKLYETFAKVVSAITLLALCSCCPPMLSRMERLRVCGSAPGLVLVYDPDTDTLAWIDTQTIRVVVRYERWERK